MVTELDSLLSTLVSSIDIYKDELREHGLPPPSSRYAHPLDAGDWPSHKIYEARRSILATLGVLTNIFITPFEKLTELTHRSGETASLHLIARLGVPDILAEAQNSGDSRRSGMSLEELSKKTSIPSRKLAGPLRLLATSGWFDEYPEEYFANTKMSEAIRAEGTALGAFDGDAYCWARATEFSARSVSGLAEALTRPAWRQSFSPYHSGCQIGHRTDKHLFEAFREKEKEGEDQEGGGHWKGLVANFTRGVQALEKSCLNPVVRDFPWASLPSGTTLVDVGGGNGGLCIALAQAYPTASLKYVIQDLPDTAQSALVNIARAFPADGDRPANANGDEPWITAEAHDFFAPQPRKGSGCSYILKWVLHNWPDDRCVEILSRLADAAGPESRVLVIDNIVTPCTMRFPPEGNMNGNVNGTSEDAQPYYVPQNYGQAGKFPLQLSVYMTSGLNASEKTLKEFQVLYERAGLRLVKVHQLTSWVSVMECIKK